MRSGLIYQIKWDTVPVVLPPTELEGLGTIITSEVITIEIQDTSVLIPDADEPQIITMLPGDSPLVISTINNAEDKFSPIKAKQAKITVKSDAALGIAASTFADSSDRRFKVVAYTPTFDIFDGFIMSPDIQQLFQPDPVDVVITATDQLGLLKGTPLLDFDGINPLGKYRIADLIAMALKPTGLDLRIKAVMNVRYGSGVFSFTAATFIASSKQIFFPSTKFFYVGQEITISGTGSNDGTYNVTAAGQGIITIIVVSQTLVDETFSGTGTVTDVSADGHFYDKIYLDAKTFESNIGECEDCYTVLEKILGEDCILFQWRGEWWIIRLDEIDDNLLYPFEFGADGTLTGADAVFNPTRQIGNDSDILHEGASTTYRFGQQQKFIKEVYKYEPPKEFVCNMDFSRGDAITPPDLSAGSSTGDYNLDCWTVRRTSGAITSTAFIRRKFNFGTEEERYVVITPQSTSVTPYNFIESQGIELVKSDKASISVSFRFENNISGSGLYVYNIMKIYLLGTDGLWYYWWTTAPDTTDLTKYRWTSSAVETDRAIDMGWNLGDINETEWRTLSVDIGPLPIDGKLYIGLYQGRQGGDSSDNQNIYYQGLNFTYQPFINGSYQLFKAQYNKVTRLTESEKYNASREREVFISDSPRREFKGAMFFLDSILNYQLAKNQFYSSNVTALGPPADIFSVHPFGYLQAFSVWNQFRNQYRIFNCSLYGFFRNEVREWPDIINKFQLSDANANSNYRYFFANEFEQNWKTMKWSVTMIELFHQVIGHRYDDTHEFRYTV